MYQHLAFLPALQPQLSFSAPSMGLWLTKLTWKAPNNIDVTTDILMHYHKFSLPEWNALCPNWVDLWRPHRLLLMKGDTISSLAWSLSSAITCRGAAPLSSFSVHTWTAWNCFLVHRKCVRATWTLSYHSQHLFNKEMSPWVCLSFTEHSYYLGERKSMGRSAACFSVLPFVLAIIATMWLWISGI